MRTEIAFTLCNPPFSFVYKDARETHIRKQARATSLTRYNRPNRWMITRVKNRSYISRVHKLRNVSFYRVMIRGVYVCWWVFAKRNAKPRGGTQKKKANVQAADFKSQDAKRGEWKQKRRIFARLTIFIDIASSVYISRMCGISCALRSVTKWKVTSSIYLGTVRTSARAHRWFK